jgi:hypothetical protein
LICVSQSSNLSTFCVGGSLFRRKFGNLPPAALSSHYKEITLTCHPHGKKKLKFFIFIKKLFNIYQKEFSVIWI